MKSSPSLFSFKYLHIVAILFLIGLALTMSNTDTVSALTSSQQITINNELLKYKKYITTHPNQFKTQESINQFYKKLKIALINKLEILNGVIDSLPVDIVSSLPITTAQPNCSGIAPSGAGVIKSTNLTSFGGGGIPPWSFNETYSWNGTDPGISCVWKCSAGYTKSGNGCIASATTNNISITVQQGSLYCGNPNKNDYTIYNPVNKIVLLNSTIVTSCNAKGGKVWTKSSNGTIENLKNISDIKDGDIFNTITATQSNCSGIAPSGVGVIKSTNLTSFGGGGIPSWGFVANTKGTDTDLGISCVWTCTPGYSRSGNGCIATVNPKIVWTDSTYVANYPEYKKSRGDKLYGYILGGDVNNTWSCLAPPTLPNTCDTISGFRKLGGAGDEWQLNTTTGRLELNGGLSVAGYPSGSYIGSVRTGQDGTTTTTTQFTIID